MLIQHGKELVHTANLCLLIFYQVLSFTRLSKEHKYALKWKQISRFTGLWETTILLKVEHKSKININRIQADLQKFLNA